MIFNKVARQVNPVFRYAFASAAATDYYKLLGIGRESSSEQIHEAFAKITRKINPDNDPYNFNKISEAFVILTDNKARDAYDSLLRSYRVSYMNSQQVKEPKTKSYLADRKTQKREQYMKKYNMDAFGRYKGGVPQPEGTKRGNALGQIGDLHSNDEFENQESYPDYQRVTPEIAESFKNFHQSQREYRTVKRPWMTLEVDYNFFTLHNLFPFWPTLRLSIILLICLPILFKAFVTLQKKMGVKKIQEIRAQQAIKAEKARVAAQAQKEAQTESA